MYKNLELFLANYSDDVEFLQELFDLTTDNGLKAMSCNSYILDVIDSNLLGKKDRIPKLYINSCSMEAEDCFSSRIISTGNLAALKNTNPHIYGVNIHMPYSQIKLIKDNSKWKCDLGILAKVPIKKRLFIDLFMLNECIGTLDIINYINAIGANFESIILQNFIDEPIDLILTAFKYQKESGRKLGVFGYFSENEIKHASDCGLDTIITDEEHIYKLFIK